MRDIYHPLKNIFESTGYTPSTGALTGSLTSGIWEPYRDSGGDSSVILAYSVVNQGSVTITVAGRGSPSDTWQDLVSFSPLTMDPARPRGVVSSIVALPQMRVTVVGDGAILQEMTLAE